MATEAVVINPDRFASRFRARDFKFQVVVRNHRGIGRVRPASARAHVCLACLNGRHRYCKCEGCACRGEFRAFEC